jgi:hypothetical protein
LENSLRTSGFKDEMSFRWKRDVAGVTVTVEFLCETEQVTSGRIFKPKSRGRVRGSVPSTFEAHNWQIITGRMFTVHYSMTETSPASPSGGK